MTVVSLEPTADRVSRREWPRLSVLLRAVVRGELKTAQCDWVCWLFSTLVTAVGVGCEETHDCSEPDVIP